jgi:hypothetical protein
MRERDKKGKRKLILTKGYKKMVPCVFISNSGGNVCHRPGPKTTRQKLIQHLYQEWND